MAVDSISQFIFFSANDSAEWVYPGVLIAMAVGTLLYVAIKNRNPRS